MFSKILIANRGEIACRITKTARRMGIKTVAVYSEADKNALHVEQADEAVLIGPPPASESYLNVENILEACKKTGAGAVHPGYGFLSERPSFAQALLAEEIVFIGPNPSSIAAMGDKIESKKFADKASVTTVPGFLGEVKDVKHASKLAKEIGYPVMLKASAGGGGKGMRIAYTEEEITDGYERARSEAKSAFGDDRLLIEKFIVNPRHIEIQILCDKLGNGVFLHERECSIQRRNQKVIEEAPSPLLDERTRQKMGQQALALAKAVSYDSAGTVEFVVDQSQNFYFLEMNTRLQVEHPVTEMITGIDLVEEMIRIAAGEKLRFVQNDIKREGWAIESRIYAEDPERNFLPSIGRLVTFRPPVEGKVGSVSTRIDSGVEEGNEIGIHYDPMIAKLVTHAADRPQAIAAQADALDSFVIEGIRHNIPFLASVMRQSRWKAGNLSTNFIPEEFPEGFRQEAPSGSVADIMAAVALSIWSLQEFRKSKISGQVKSRPKMSSARVVSIGKKKFSATVERENFETCIITFIGEKTPQLSVKSEWRPGNPLWSGRVGQENARMHYTEMQNTIRLQYAGQRADIQIYSTFQAAVLSRMPKRPLASATKTLNCPMPGLVKQILVRAGQKVRAGELLVIVEAMKMENALRAENDAEIKSIAVQAGDSIAVDALILEFG
jgi:propionyl-CoA carboxylase alpha chain